MSAAREASHSSSFSSGDRWGTVDEVAELLGVSRDFIYQHAAELAGRKIGASPKAPWRFRLEDVLAATSCQEIRRPASESPASVRRRRSRSGTGVPLLPIRGANRG
jgi:excisionase family DNA binding protein